MNRIDTLKTFLSKTPGDPFLLHAMALEYVKMSEEEQARALFEQIISANPAYTGSYYHLGKLLERTGDAAGAIRVYEAGMAACREAGENHAYNELQSAYEDLAYS